MIEYSIIVALVFYLLIAMFFTYVSIKVAPKPLTARALLKSFLAGILFPFIFIWWLLTSD